MNTQIEVCIDNIESLHNAIAGGATRIELCSSLALGGLTPSFGLMKKAAEISTIPVYAMIRPRQGDFLYDQDDIDSMLIDIEMAKQAGLDGIVFGILNPNRTINIEASQQMIKAAQGLGSTFHRAIDQCHSYKQAIEDVASLGCERILTSGLAPNAYNGRSVIAEMVKLAGDRFSIMAGAGLNASNIGEVIKETGITEIHLSSKSTRASKMDMIANAIKMGHDSIDETLIPVTDVELLQEVVRQLS
ncbi:copper homeostasis protein CutC [Vibrio sp. S12_S33]|uniref:copper homeostasis protein CutC n=1 Tax=Vibrio sp. S12_S33 TaxID=2720223 RepID=UPI001780226B|nr:copper homeostasis protein CutC [Vibrio sp. S12_S33]MBD1566715.1 copper homeostasis protein CutC [Vibrio sp. S12_S33]